MKIVLLTILLNFIAGCSNTVTYTLGVSKKEFEKIKEGMKEKEMIELLGTPQLKMPNNVSIYEALQIKKSGKFLNVRLYHMVLCAKIKDGIVARKRIVDVKKHSKHLHMYYKSTPPVKMNYSLFRDVLTDFSRRDKQKE